MSLPIIGVTTDCNDRRTQYSLPYGYTESVERAGGLPFLIPYRTNLSLIRQIVDRLDGIVFSGGDDLDPIIYGESRHEKAEAIDPARETFERALLAEVEKRRLPTLGICLGSQLMNTHRGGSLIQFLPEVTRNGALEHRRLEDWGRRHPVSLVPGTAVADITGKSEIIVNTSHKQSVNKPGRNLRVIATSPDGIIEGVEDPSLPMFVGVQWHPERLTAEMPEHLALFKRLVDVSRARSGR